MSSKEVNETAYRYRCDCGAFMRAKATHVKRRKQYGWCEGGPVVKKGRLHDQSRVNRAILRIKGWDHLGIPYRFERLAACNETEEVHKPHRFVVDQWYDHIRTCKKCGRQKAWWSYEI